MNINTKDYWDHRFSTGDWESKAGRKQTRQFAETQVPLLGLPRSFSGKLLDFGCGLGDAIPVYREAFPDAELFGLDLSAAAIEKCRRLYGNEASFMCGNYSAVPQVDVIIASNVFEHLSNDKEIAAELLKRCGLLCIVVPYKEKLAAVSEHVNSYVESSFRNLGDQTATVFCSRGWSQYGWSLWFDVHAKNLIRPFFGRRRVSRNRQIMFHLRVAGVERKATD